jgi:hypothetical protein
MLLSGVCGLVAVAGGIWLLVVAFKESLVWGLVCLLCPPAPIVFAIMHWEKAKKPFLIELCGAVLASIFSHLAYR